MFITTKGLPIRQENLGKRWRKAFSECQKKYRRMYETRHTFASWALAAGESPGWVARTLGHVNTAIGYRTYGRYIFNLTRHDGSEFERRYTDAINKEKKSLGTILGTICKNRRKMGRNYLKLLNGNWSGRLDLNQRPQRPERCALPG